METLTHAQQTSAALKAWQSALKLTQAQAAKALGMSLSAYKDHLSGKNRRTGKPSASPDVVLLAAAWHLRSPCADSALNELLSALDLKNAPF